MTKDDPAITKAPTNVASFDLNNIKITPCY
jgi:hypothetical protein